MRLALLGVTLWAAAACSTETGVLIEISQDQQGVAVEQLVVYVGQGSLDRFDGHFADFEPEQDIDVAGRDLSADPYRLMLRPGERKMDMMVAVLGYGAGDVVAFGALEQPVPFVDGKVTRWPIVLHSGVPDGFTISETGCVLFLHGDGRYIKIGRPGDLDCDGWTATDDCNDLAPDVNPGSTDVCGNAIDEDCDDAIDENVDDDQDAVTTCDGDCNDQDPKVHPGSIEVCDGQDNDCNHLCDDGMDGDGDRYTACGSYLKDDGSCELDDSIVDCDDRNATVHPWADEVCDGVDNDCNGVCEDNAAVFDRDGDGFTSCGTIVGFCGQSDAYVDCAPEDGAVHPAAVELCNGEDDNCDGQFSSSERCFLTDNQEACYQGVRGCDEDTGVLGACESTAVASALAPNDACTEFAICEEAEDPARYQCAVEGLDGDDIGCAVHVRVVDGVQCEGREVLLPTGGLAECTWRMVGTGNTSGDYVAGLRALGVNTVPTRAVESCQAVLRVDAIGPTPAPETLILIRDSDANGPETILLHLGLEATAACGPPAGLVCEGLSPVTDDI